MTPSETVPDAAAAPRARPRGRFWPLAIITLLGAGMVADLAFLVIATSHSSYAVDEAYSRGSHDGVAELARASAALGWSAQVEVRRGTQPGRTQVEVRIVDADGQAVHLDGVELRAFHHARPRDVLSAELAALDDGAHGSELALRRSGLWEFRVDARRGEDRFRQRLSTVVWRP